MDVIKTFQFSEKKTKWKENPSILEDFSFQKRHTVWLFMKTNILKVGIHTSIDAWWLKYSESNSQPPSGAIILN